MKDLRLVLWMLLLIALPSFALKQPTENLVLLVTDEQGQPSSFYKPHLIDWWNELAGEKFMREHGVTFANYFANTLACTPIRTLMDTGLFPRVTGCIKTDGFSTRPTDPEMNWLPVENGRSVFPTLAHFLEAGGYKAENIFHIGKFHLAFLDLWENGRPLETLDEAGTRIPETLQRYIAENLYAPFGYFGKTGEEPHGREWRNSALKRDPFFVEEALDIIRLQSEKYLSGDTSPFILKLNLVNPHDVVLAVGMWMHNLIPEGIEEMPVPPPVEQAYMEAMLKNEEQVLKDYREIYPLLYSNDPIVKDFYTSEKGRAIVLGLYYWLMREVESQVMTVIEALQQAPFYKNTWIIKTSDHGDMLGIFDLWQKWHTLRKEVTHIPFSVYHPAMITEPRSISAFASHIDLLPTILGLLGIDMNEIKNNIARNFPKARTLVGRDLSKVILQKEEPNYTEPVYFITEDEISNGSNSFAALSGFIMHHPHEKQIPPSHFPTISGMRRIEGIRFLEGCREWSVMRYFNPDNNDEAWQVFDIAADEHEIVNIAHEIPADRLEHFQRKLFEARNRYNDPPMWGVSVMNQ